MNKKLINDKKSETENFFEKNLKWILWSLLFLMLFAALVFYLLKNLTSIW
ncbi:hypothetical protein J4429_03085 [Candidatus Pacearchaeota archaeon]|nr:hypothetical protein [Candidatus Pacearchaeota archaeon]